LLRKPGREDHLQVGLFWRGHSKKAYAGTRSVYALLKAELLREPLERFILIFHRDGDARESIYASHTSSCAKV
jgi:hypothetical protein